MQTKRDLISKLHDVDRNSYPAYKQLKGSYDMVDFVLNIDHVQGDPFASPSMLSVFISGAKAGFPKHLYETKEKKIALENLLLRWFSGEMKKYAFREKGSGKSGFMGAASPGPENLPRTGCEISVHGDVLVRFEVGFPANGRRIQSNGLEKILLSYIPKIVSSTLVYEGAKEQKYLEVANLAEDQAYIREQLKTMDLVAFVANGAILPRESGVSSRPMKDAIPFKTPETMEVEMNLPHFGTMKGMGIPKGITMIVGGGFHGKSTLLKALEVGVYNHVLGDGREYVITDETAMKIRAEDGRSIQKVDISMFINNLPNGKDTKSFSTPDASGSTSQAANVVEAMEAGSRLFLVDEDTSATNFMVCDELMQQVVHRDMEPITPFSDTVLEIYHSTGISTVLVAGSSGSFFYSADKVIQMLDYKPVDITERAKQFAGQYPHPTKEADSLEFPDFSKTRIWRKMADAKERVKMKVVGRDTISINKETIDLRYVEQLVEQGQLSGLAQIIWFIRTHYFTEQISMKEMVDRVEELMEKERFHKIASGNISGNWVVPRRQEIFACLNRWR
ncbi:MAG: ABC-ATPase domain-containing protein [Eubacterium sp.]|nr:ABC-ATPase domain-containing protein [Eubacterium sp.]